jgi:hypothetical protein
LTVFSPCAESTCLCAMDIPAGDLTQLPRRDLQALAKTHGLKANSSTAALAAQLTLIRDGAPAEQADTAATATVKRAAVVSPAAPAAEDEAVDTVLPVRRLSPTFSSLADSPVAGLVVDGFVQKQRGHAAAGAAAPTPFARPPSAGAGGSLDDEAPATGFAQWVRSSLDSLTKTWTTYLKTSPRTRADEGTQPEERPQGAPAVAAAKPAALLPAAKRDLNSNAPVAVFPGAKRPGQVSSFVFCGKPGPHTRLTPPLQVAPVVLSRLPYKAKTGPVQKPVHKEPRKVYDAKASLATKGALPWRKAAAPAPPPAKPAAVVPSAAARRATIAPGARLASAKPAVTGASKRTSMAVSNAAASRRQTVQSARKRSIV